MRVVPITNHNNQNQIHQNNYSKSNMSFSVNDSISFKGKTKLGLFASIGALIDGLFSYINNIGKSEPINPLPKDDIPWPDEREYRQNHPAPNDDWPDTAF